MTPFVASSYLVYDALHAAGVIAEEPRNVRRVVIDLRAGHIAMVYVEQFADAEKLAAAIPDVGIQIQGIDER